MNRLINTIFIILLAFGLSAAEPSSCFQELNLLITHQEIKTYDYDIYRYREAESLIELERLYGDSNLFDVYSRLLENDIKNINDHTLNIIHKNQLDDDGVELTEVQSIFDRLIDNYNYATKNIHKSICDRNGFCYARATMAHMMALKRGIKSKNLKKIWVLGQLKSDINDIWNYHVALVIKGKEDSYVLDTSFGLKTLSEFHAHFQKTENHYGKRPLSVMTQASRYQIGHSGSYNSFELFPPPEQDWNFGFYYRAFEELQEGHSK